MDAAALDYDLPEDAIAQVPVEPRDAARLLVDGGPGRRPRHHVVADLPDLLRPGDLLVLNDTRVRPARLRLRRPGGGPAEVLLLDPGEGGRWEALVRPGRKLRPGTRLEGPDGLVAVVGDDLGAGRRVVTIEGDVEAAGELPLPPYIHVPLADPERYQTVYARRAASAAAPTAGLHLTDDVLARCRDRGVDMAVVELAVGLDTFRPMTESRVEDHVIHREAYAVSEATMAACDRADRVVAVGTTVVRALESAAATGELSGHTALFIHGDYRFRVVDVLLTNFHLPRTTLLALIDAFVGPRWRHLYEIAQADGYRFLSFGDAMLLTRGRGEA
jgi:S-adenosylmethionine:tRNA ribosyltransferase-isomerase